MPINRKLFLEPHTKGALLGKGIAGLLSKAPVDLGAEEENKVDGKLSAALPACRLGLKAETIFAGRLSQMLGAIAAETGRFVQKVKTVTFFVKAQKEKCSVFL